MPDVRHMKHPTELALTRIIIEIENLGQDPDLDKVLWVVGIGRMKLSEYFDAHPEVLGASTG
jgi:hypothetical protein